MLTIGWLLVAINTEIQILFSLKETSILFTIKFVFIIFNSAKIIHALEKITICRYGMFFHLIISSMYFALRAIQIDKHFICLWTRMLIIIIAIWVTIVYSNLTKQRLKNYENEK